MHIFEVLMLLCFAASWPFSIVKALRTKVVAGKSPLFMTIIEIGYVFGILYKVTSPDRDWRVWLYVLNLVIVGTDLFLYYLYRPRKEPVPSFLRSSVSSVTAVEVTRLCVKEEIAVTTKLPNDQTKNGNGEDEKAVPGTSRP